MKNIIFVLLITVLSSGCATAQRTINAGAGLAKAAKPEHRDTIELIRKAIAGNAEASLDGFRFSRTYFYEGRVVADPSMITWEDKWVKTESADKTTPPASKSYSATDSAIIADINAILDAAGVEE